MLPFQEKKLGGENQWSILSFCTTASLVEFLNYHFRLHFLITRLFSSTVFLSDINNNRKCYF